MSRVISTKARAALAFLPAILVAALVLALAPSESRAATIVPSSTTVTVGDTLQIIVELTAADRIGAIDMVLFSDPTLVARTGVAAGSMFSGLALGLDYIGIAPSFATTASTYSTAILFAVDQVGPAEFLKLSFTATATGTAAFNLFGRGSNDLSTGTFPISASASVLIKDKPSETDPPVIPLPASALLLAAALGGLAQFRIRRNIFRSN